MDLLAGVNRPRDVRRFPPPGVHRSRHSVILLPRHDHPHDPGHLVRQSDRRDHPRLASDDLPRPIVRHNAFRMTHRIRLIAPTINSLRMSVCPILLTPPSGVLAPVDRCHSTRPSHAAKFLPLAKVRRSGANAITAPAVTGPTPGTVHSVASRRFPVSRLSA